MYIFDSFDHFTSMGSEQDIWQVLYCSACFGWVWWHFDFIVVEWSGNDLNCGDAFLKVTEKGCQFYQVFTKNSKHKINLIKKKVNKVGRLSIAQIKSLVRKLISDGGYFYKSSMIFSFFSYLFHQFTLK